MSPTQKRIEETIASAPVVLFMKGSRFEPRCGFSARVVQILDSLLPEYRTVDVLSEPAIREGIKEFTSWPTIPQLFIQGEFIGGADIVTELFQSGELASKLGVQRAMPDISITKDAVEALAGYMEAENEVVRLEISQDYEHALSIGPEQTTDVIIESNGVRVALDQASVRRAGGVVIDFVKTGDGGAFKIVNPNEPPRVKPLSVKELKSRLDTKAEVLVLDVRTAEEQRIASIPGTQPLTEATAEELLQGDKNRPIAFLCHHGHRSQRAAEQFLARGFRDVYNVVGGIDAWSVEIDPSVPRY